MLLFRFPEILPFHGSKINNHLSESSRRTNSLTSPRFRNHFDLEAFWGNLFIDEEQSKIQFLHTHTGTINLETDILRRVITPSWLNVFKGDRCAEIWKTVWSYDARFSYSRSNADAKRTFSMVGLNNIITMNVLDLNGTLSKNGIRESQCFIWEQPGSAIKTSKCFYKQHKNWKSLTALKFTQKQTTAVKVQFSSNKSIFCLTFWIKRIYILLAKSVFLYINLLPYWLFVEHYVK